MSQVKKRKQKKSKKQKNSIRLGIEYCLLMIHRYCEKAKPSGKAYHRKQKHKRKVDDHD